jgi:hypothetical protein
MKEQIVLDYKVLSIKPLYLYDHSGITISTKSFNDRWDSGQVGWVIVDEKQLNKICGEDYERSEEKLSSIIEGEVDTYDKYLTGEVYRYEVYEVETCSLGHEHRNLVESCGGYFGYDNCKQEGESVLQYLEKNLSEVEQ